MEGNNLQFKLLSLNVRSVRTFDKRKCILNWLGKQDVDICFLQDTYSSNEIEKQWKKRCLERRFILYTRDFTQQRYSYFNQTGTRF